MDAAAGLPSGWLWWLMLFLMLVILILAGIILHLLREQAKAGNKQAADILRGFEAGKEVIPLDKVRSLLDQMERRADETITPWDDILAGAIRKGVEMVLQRTPPTEGEIPAPATAETIININTPDVPPTGGAPIASATGFQPSAG